MMNRITSRSAWIGNEYPSLAGEGAGAVDEEGAAAEEPSEGDGPDQKTSGSCNKVQGYVPHEHKRLFLFYLLCLYEQLSTVLLWTSE